MRRRTVTAKTGKSTKVTTPKIKPVHHAHDFDIDVQQGDYELFKWFLLSYLFGKPIRSATAIDTWRLFVDSKLDTPWAINDAKVRHLVRVLYAGKYTRYAEVTAAGLQTCMRQLIRDYEGSLMLMYEYSQDEEQFSKRLQTLHGVGPKVAEIFMRETEELFAQRIE